QKEKLLNKQANDDNYLEKRRTLTTLLRFTQTAHTCVMGSLSGLLIGKRMAGVNPIEPQFSMLTYGDS
ncbi:hypothetical protein, partial [Vibrio fluvialis]|uniref:hypothetical protein n=1 Tax=Vibrio fluvialis TaxID=676 RepID=UPI001EEF0953